MTDAAASLTPSALKVASALSQRLLGIVRPFFWQVNGCVLSGASAFVLRFEQRLVAVTAEHVIAQYLAAKGNDHRVRCQLGQCFVSLEDVLIGRSRDLDIATFEVDPNSLPAMGAEAIDCRDAWPPPAVHVGDTLTLAGYLDNHRAELSRGYYEHQAWGGHGIADDVTARNIVTTYSQGRDLALGQDIPTPPPKFNMSGCSGGLAVLVRNVDGEMCWYPAAVIYKGPSALSSGDFEDIDLIHLRPLSFIHPDGTLDDPHAGGWLPG